MRIDSVEAGMLAKAKAGHDKDAIYVISQVDDTYVYLVDGKKRTFAKPKKKKRKHVQIICDKQDVSGMNDIDIKRRLKLFDKEIGRI